jgi:hypothetical protein
MLVVGFELGLLEGLEKAIEQEQVLVLWVVRHHYHEANDPVVHLV